MNDADPAQLGEDRVMVGRSTVDIATRADDLISAGLGRCKTELAGAARRNAGRKAVRRSFDRNIEHRAADRIAPV
jgi:hypothetical protein